VFDDLFKIKLTYKKIENFLTYKKKEKEKEKESFSKH